MAPTIQLYDEADGGTRTDRESQWFAQFSPVNAKYLVWFGNTINGDNAFLTSLRWMNQPMTLLDQRVGFGDAREFIWGLANPSNGPGNFFAKASGNFISVTVQGAAIFFSNTSGLSNLKALQQTQNGSAWHMQIDESPLLTNENGLLCSTIHTTNGFADLATPDSGDILVPTSVNPSFGSGSYLSQHPYNGDKTLGWSSTNSTNGRTYTQYAWEMGGFPTKSAFGLNVGNIGSGIILSRR